MSAVSARSIASPKISSGVFYSSDFCELKHWQYDFRLEGNTTSGFNDCLCVVYVKKGNFLFDLSRSSYDTHSGHLIIDKPDYEYRMRPAAGELTIFNFTNEFYRQYVDDCDLRHAFFFSNPNILSLMLNATAEMDYLHFQILRRASGAGRLEMDNLVMEMFSKIIELITNESARTSLKSSAKAIHLRPVEMAKEYIQENFASDISLYEISDHCCVSPFHFSRIFKKFTSYSPHQYLHNVRLKHGESLLRTSNRLVSDIAFASGFNSLEYFATAFKQRYKMSPTQYRGQ